MIKSVQIENITADELFDTLEKRMAARSQSLDSGLGDFYIERSFLTLNLGLTYRQIVRYEKQGVLRKVALPDNQKAVRYRLADAAAVREAELKQLYPNR